MSEGAVEEEMFGTGRDGVHPEVVHPPASLLCPLPPVKLHQALGRVLGEVVRGAGEADVVLRGDQTGHEAGARIFLLAGEDLAVTAGNHQARAASQAETLRWRTPARTRWKYLLANLHHDVCERPTGVETNPQVYSADLTGNLVNENLRVGGGKCELLHQDVAQFCLLRSFLQNI